MATHMTSQSVPKLDAATRQLQVSIVLYFRDEDPLAVHTLAGAAHGLFRDLAVRSDRAAPIRAKDGRRKTKQIKLVERMVNESKNFLKHADRDPDRVLRFNPAWTDYVLHDAIRMQLQLTLNLPPASTIFLIWIEAQYPTLPLLDGRWADDMANLRLLFSKLGGVDARKRIALRVLRGEEAVGAWDSKSRIALPRPT
jgi:hypothetical protein